MSKPPFSKPTEPEIRQRSPRILLEVDRTSMANERTLLAYIRTALTEIVVGVSLLKLFTGATALVAGWVFLVGAGCTMAWGVVRVRKTRRLIRHWERDQRRLEEEEDEE